jgi:uncharacterized protein involved in outer membrane biogenesis
MSRGIKYASIGFIVLLVVAFVVLTISVDSIVKSGIERIGTEMTGTPVTVEDASISVFSGQGTVRGLRVSNPEGYHTTHALVVDDFFIKLDLRTLLSDMIVIDEVIVMGPAVFLEQKLPGNNLLAILQRIREAESKGTSAETDVLISYLLIQDGTVDFYTRVGGERSARVEMAPIEMHDLGGRDRGSTVERAVREIADRIIEQALRTVPGSGVERLKEMFEGFFR